MKTLMLIPVMIVLLAPRIVFADKVEAANKEAKENFGQFVQEAAKDEAFREALPANGYKNFGAWVSSQKKEGRGGEDAVRGKSDGHRRDSRGGSDGGGTVDGVASDDGGDTLGTSGNGRGRGRGKK